MAKEIISEFKGKPKTKTARRVIALGLGTVLGSLILGIFTAVVRPMIDRTSGENVGTVVGFSLMIVLLMLALVAIITGVRAFKKGERSWVLWLGFIPAILNGAMWLLMVMGEFIFPH